MVRFVVVLAHSKESFSHSLPSEEAFEAFLETWEQNTGGEIITLPSWEGGKPFAHYKLASIHAIREMNR